MKYFYFEDAECGASAIEATNIDDAIDKIHQHRFYALDESSVEEISLDEIDCLGLDVF